MKMVMIAYNEALDDEVSEAVRACGIEGFTRWNRVFGRGRASGPHLGTNIWPKANNVMAVCAGDEAAARLLAGLRKLRERSAKEGIKAFVLPCEEVT